MSVSYRAPLDNRAMPLDADAQNLVRLALPPGMRKDLHVAVAAVPGGFHHGTDAAQIDDPVTRHAAIEHEIAGRHEPVAHMIGKNPLSAARDLPRQIRIPP